jgi:MarR family transcriptional regulator, organic hydroperoxide resistance regulator
MAVTDNQRILDSIRRLVQLLRLSDRAAQMRVGLSTAQAFVLAELGKEDALSLKDLAERTRTDQSSVSVVVARLVASGYITRERAEDDARRLVLKLTRNGRAALQRVPAVAQERLIEALETLPASARRQFADTFTKLIEAMGAEKGTPPMLFEDPSARRKKPK